MAQYERQHYIPQFWIRYFADEYGYVNYFNKKSGKTSCVTPNQIFFYKNLYDRKKNKHDIKQTEKNFAKQEAEAKKIIDKFQTGREVIVSKEEYAKLILFLHVLGFRNKKGLSDMRKHKNDPNIEKDLKSISQEIEGTEDAWLLVLNDFSNIQNISDLHDYHKASKSVRTQAQFMIRYFHVNVFECKKGTLILSDMLPITQQIETLYGKQGVIFCYPISKTRILVSSFNGLYRFSELKTLIPKEKLSMPYSNETHMKLRVSTLYPKQIEELNEAFKKYCTEGYIE